MLHSVMIALLLAVLPTTHAAWAQPTSCRINKRAACGTYSPYVIKPNAALASRSSAPMLLTRGIGEGRELPAPSGINTQPKAVQAGIVIAILAAIAGGTFVIAGPFFDALRGSGAWNFSRPTWPLIGVIYLVAGVAHFTELEGFENITPPNGTWGFWYTPFSPKFNVIWTGVVEVLAGAALLLGWLLPLAGVALPPPLSSVVSDAALALMLLTAVVTPANIYALTHGANFPLEVETPPVAHAVRLAFQSLLLAMFYEMARPTIDAFL
uniref:Uncharacterized protein n=1 Tax=Chrysotila carterae TaxID=13221 RepID=A0A7S4FCT8_CHRCT|mmetsp:Transcript_7138/g.15741  ORF Transcript_7138/g.15741 Transcript_7138/m.15741 type:complete len:267 (+) Transcript_7138:139-939(+)